MTRIRARSERAEWLFDAGQRRPLSRELLTAAGLRWQPLADVRLTLVQFGRAGLWHLAPGTDPASCDHQHAHVPPVCPASRAAIIGEQACARARRAAARGQAPKVRQAGLLDGDRLCPGCLAGLTVPGPEGAYLALAWQILAAQDWVTALEHAAPSADWLACCRWAARHPFTGPHPVDALLAIMPSDPLWADCAAAAETAWEEICERDIEAHQRARQVAGSPGYRAIAACARSLVAAGLATRSESRSVAAIAGQARSYDDAMRPWAIASDAWLAATCQDGDPAAGQRALRAALADAYAGILIRDLALLPALTTRLEHEEYRSASEWAQADYQAALHVIAAAWNDRLDAQLTELLGQPTDCWQLLLVLGWPLTSDGDRDLAYLASYPEHARVPDPHCGRACRRAHDSWAVVLHVPEFAISHALTHDSPHHHAIPGPRLPAGAQPSLAQIRAVLRQAPDPDDDPDRSGRGRMRRS